uniref:ORF46a n=1 Tax=Pinus thunbergii TaxID=3350 RepID=Q32933_PINTH|nr:ORF46a [Pinus thunbergii]
MDRSNLLSFQVIRPSFKYSMRCMLKSTIKEMDLICSPSFFRSDYFH